MAKNPVNGQQLSFVEIVMRADAETIKQAYEARVKVDGLLAEREEAYRKIAELENKVDEIIGEPGVFVFPEPPLPVSGFARPVSAPAKKPAGKATAKDSGTLSDAEDADKGEAEGENGK